MDYIMVLLVIFPNRSDDTCKGQMDNGMVLLVLFPA